MNIVTKEEYGGEEAEGYEIKSNPKGLLMYSEMPGLGSLLAKDKDTDVIFIQNNLFFIDFGWVCRLLKALFTYQTKNPLSRVFLEFFLEKPEKPLFALSITEIQIMITKIFLYFQ